jgi:serine/threonine-protein kinase
MEQAVAGRQARGWPAWADWRRGWLRRNLWRTDFKHALSPRVGDTVGGYHLEAKLGAGGYGTVFRARRGGQLYAVKFLYLPRVAEWAWRELEVMLRVRRVGALRLEGHGRWPDRSPRFLFLAMEYVKGPTLYQWAERHNPTARQVARVVLALARQLAAVHAVDVVHRDVKGANVLVCEASGEPVLVDFGVGTYAGAPEVTGPLPPGTASYRSPEALRFRLQRQEGERYPSTPLDDLWALGVVLYWLLTGGYPFDDANGVTWEEALLQHAPVAPHTRNPRVPRALGELCLRLLEKAPEARYPHATAVAEALEAALAGADASWDVALCEEWGPSTVTTLAERALDPEQDEARGRRLAAFEQAHPRRGSPETPGEPSTPLPSTRSASPREDAEEESSSAPHGRAVAWGLALLGAVVALALFALTGPRPAPEVSAPVATVASPVLAARVREAWPPPGQEVAPLCEPPEGAGGAAPPWATTSAPVASATRPQDSTRVKTSPKDSSSQQKPQRQGTVLDTVARALCTAAVGATAAGCSGAQVRNTPAPEACPAGSVETMKQLGINPGDETGAQFPGEVTSFATVREGPGAQLVLGRPLGQLATGTVLTGQLLFAKERVYGRFIAAQTPGGDTYRVCLEAWGGLKGVRMRGLTRHPAGGPDTARVTFAPRVKAVEHFE